MSANRQGMCWKKREHIFLKWPRILHESFSEAVCQIKRLKTCLKPALKKGSNSVVASKSNNLSPFLQSKKHEACQYQCFLRQGEKYILEWPFDFKIESQSLGCGWDTIFLTAKWTTYFLELSIQIFYQDSIQNIYPPLLCAEKHIRPLTLKPSEYTHLTSKMSCQ